MAAPVEQMEAALSDSFERVEIEDMSGGDGYHYRIIVEDKVFNGMNMVKQHKAVYEKLGTMFDKDELHAVTLVTRGIN